MSAESTLPRVVRFNGVEVYAARCDHCGSDRYPEWVELPELEELRTTDYVMGLGVCIGRMCADAYEYGPRPVDAGRAECWRAREPERLAARLEELRREAGR